jgi:nicotinate-nucleotide pyrophosphorylase (carboxylating)
VSAPGIADRIASRLGWDDIDPGAVRQLVELARREDLEGWGLKNIPARSGDITSQIIHQGNAPASADLVARCDMIVAGLPLVQLVLDAYGEAARFEPAVIDGAVCARGERLGSLHGPARQILEAERVILNFLQRLSGVASLTRTFVQAMGGSPTRLLDTRKTTPGYRVLEKYAVARGGGFNHRIGLFDRVMLKDNHLAAENAGSGEALAALVKRAREESPDLVIELEVDRLGQIPPALQAGVDVILLDNFCFSELREAVALIGDRAATEASGGINLNALPKLASIGLDFISTGATVHQSTWMDIGLDWGGAK